MKHFSNTRLGGSWTTDAPFRETEQAIDHARSENLYAVEMEAAALYALAESKGYPILCVAHVTNVMARTENDFEKGEHSGNAAFRQLISIVSKILGNDSR
jgi:uridine phosphorylase